MKFNAKNQIKDLNTLKSELSSEFSREDLYNGLKKYNLPCTIVFCQLFIKRGLIKRVGVNSYSFCNPKKPIHYSVLESIYIDSCNYYKDHSTKHRLNKQFDVVKEDIVIKGAIELLKRKGFVIYYKNGTQM